MDSEIKEHLSSTRTWGRALFMVLFGIIYSVAKIVLLTVVIFQFFFMLFTGEVNARLLQFGGELNEFVYRIFLYLTYNSEEKPFPFDSWPTVNEESPADHGRQAEQTAPASQDEDDKPSEK